MTKQNFKPYNQKPIQIVQEVENAWEQEIEKQEQEVREEIEAAQIYEAEVVEEGVEQESNLAHQPSSGNQTKSSVIDPNTRKLVFQVGIKLKDCYFTDAGTWATLFWYHDQVRKIFFEKVSGAEDLLRQLESGNIRVVDGWGMESEKSRSLRKELMEGLREFLTRYENGEMVVGWFEE